MLRIAQRRLRSCVHRPRRGSNRAEEPRGGAGARRPARGAWAASAGRARRSRFLRRSDDDSACGAAGCTAVMQSNHRRDPDGERAQRHRVAIVGDWLPAMARLDAHRSRSTPRKRERGDALRRRVLVVRRRRRPDAATDARFFAGPCVTQRQPGRRAIVCAKVQRRTIRAPWSTTTSSWVAVRLVRSSRLGCRRNRPAASCCWMRVRTTQPPS